MPLCLLALIGLPLLLTLGTTHARIQQMHALEAKIIALDNAGIRLGRSARSVWNGLRAANAGIRALEGRHHLFHACARVPATAGSCQVVDRAMEAELVRQQGRAALWAKALWREGDAQARVELPVARFSRPSLPPIQPVRCPVCGQAAGWEIVSRRTESIRLPGGQGLRVRWVGQSLRGGAPWDYALEDEDG